MAAASAGAPPRRSWRPWRAQRLAAAERLKKLGRALPMLRITQRESHAESISHLLKFHWSMIACGMSGPDTSQRRRFLEVGSHSAKVHDIHCGGT